MTAPSLILGVLPLMFASGVGVASRTSIGFVVFGGMVAASVVGVVFIPMLYYVVERARDACWRSAKKRGTEAINFASRRMIDLYSSRRRMPDGRQNPLSLLLLESKVRRRRAGLSSGRLDAARDTA